MLLVMVSWLSCILDLSRLLPLKDCRDHIVIKYTNTAQPHGLFLEVDFQHIFLLAHTSVLIKTHTYINTHRRHLTFLFASPQSHTKNRTPEGMRLFFVWVYRPAGVRRPVKRRRAGWPFDRLPE